MNITVWTTCHWSDQSAAHALASDDSVFGLKAWYERVKFLFRPNRVILACGTWSDPSLNPLAHDAEVVNAGIPSGPIYDVVLRQYWMAATMAALASILNRNDHELAVFLDTDCLVGAVDFRELLDRFIERPEELLSPAWNSNPGGPFMALKRPGCVRFFHQRKQGNLFDQGLKPMLGEDEIGKIFSGTWWDPWDGMEMRQDYGTSKVPNPMRCPFIRQPIESVVKPFIETQWSRAVPV